MSADNILIKPIRLEDINKEGLVNPEQYEDKPEWGEVISVGSGKILDNGTILPIDYQAGDTVLYGMYSPYKTRIDGEDYLIVRAEDIISKYREV